MSVHDTLVEFVYIVLTLCNARDVHISVSLQQDTSVAVGRFQSFDHHGDEREEVSGKKGGKLVHIFHLNSSCIPKTHKRSNSVVTC